MVLGRFGRFLLLCLFLLSVAALPPVSHAEGPPIDLQRDADGDGFPDALVAAVKKVEAAAQDEAKGKGSAATDAAIDELSRRLPFTGETRALQQRAQALQKQLASAKDEKAAERINSELASISQKMQADPNVARTKDLLTKMFVPEAAVQRTTNSASNETQTFRAAMGPNWGGLRRGHIMLVRSSWWTWNQFIYSMWYTHAGNYDGNNLVYEANPSDGSRLKPLSNWQGSGHYVALAYSRYRSNDDVGRGLNWAKSRYGWDGQTPYNYFFPDKWTDSRLYCSQLVWKVHLNTGIDLDSNNWQYLAYVGSIWGVGGVAAARSAVAPDEIARDGDVAIYSASWN